MELRSDDHATEESGSSPSTRTHRAWAGALGALGIGGAMMACALDSQGIGAGADASPLSDAAVDASIARADADDVTQPALDGAIATDGAEPDARDATADSAPRADAAPNGLSVWLHGDSALDEQLHLVPLVKRGAPATHPAGDGGTAWTLAGGEDALVYGSASTVIDDSRHLTIEGWIAPTSLANARIVDRSTPNQPETGWGFDILTNGVLRTFYGPFTAPFHAVQTPAAAVVSGKWQHVAGTIAVTPDDGGTTGVVVMQLYIGGVVQSLDWTGPMGSTPGQFADARTIPPGSLPVVFGGSTQTGANLGLVGQLAEIALWKRTLTATQIKSIADNGPAARCSL